MPSKLSSQAVIRGKCKSPGNDRHGRLTDATGERFVRTVPPVTHLVTNHCIAPRRGPFFLLLHHVAPCCIHRVGSVPYARSDPMHNTEHLPNLSSIIFSFRHQ